MRIYPIHARGTSWVLLHIIKSYNMGPLALLPIRKEGVLRICIALKKSIALAGLQPTTFASSDKHTNHCTTKVTYNDCNNSMALEPSRLKVRFIQFLASWVHFVHKISVWG
jgi:hypothetical protein